MLPVWLIKNWKVALYIVVGLAIFILWQRDRTAQWNKGVDYGDSRTQLKMEKKFKEDIAKIQDAIDVERAQLEKDKKAVEEKSKSLDAKSVAIDKIFEASDKKLGHALDIAAIKKEEIDAIVKSVPTSLLDERIRLAARANKAPNR